MQSRKLVAEFLGTFLLVLLAVGAAVSGIAGSVGAALAPFGDMPPIAIGLWR